MQQSDSRCAVWNRRTTQLSPRTAWPTESGEIIYRCFKPHYEWFLCSNKWNTGFIRERQERKLHSGNSKFCLYSFRVNWLAGTQQRSQAEILTLSEFSRNTEENSFCCLLIHKKTLRVYLQSILVQCLSVSFGYHLSPGYSGFVQFPLLEFDRRKPRDWKRPPLEKN